MSRSPGLRDSTETLPSYSAAMRRAFTCVVLPICVGSSSIAASARIADNRACCSGVKLPQLCGSATCWPKRREMRNVQSSSMVQTVPVVPAKPSCVSFTVSGVLSMHPLARACQPPGIATVATSRSNARHIPTIHCDVIPRIVDKIQPPQRAHWRPEACECPSLHAFLPPPREGALRTRNLLAIYHISTSSTHLSVYNCTPMLALFPGALPCQDCTLNDLSPTHAPLHEN